MVNCISVDIFKEFEINLFRESAIGNPLKEKRKIIKDGNGRY